MARKLRVKSPPIGSLTFEVPLRRREGNGIDTDSSRDKAQVYLEILYEIEQIIDFSSTNAKATVSRFTAR